MATGYAEIKEYIMDKIHTGEWPIDCMIPTEMQLCEQFGVSRPTVRTALLKLVEEGHLKRIKGKGSFVTTPRILEQTTVFIESFFREMQERGFEITTEVLELRRLDLCKLPAEERDRIRTLLETSKNHVIKLSRLRYVKDSFDKGPIVLTTSYFSEDKTFLLEQDFEKVSMTSALNENGCRREYLEKEFTAVTLGAKESRLMGVAEGSLAMLVSTVSRDGDGGVVEITESLFPMARNQFVLKLKV